MLRKFVQIIIQYSLKIALVALLVDWLLMTSAVLAWLSLMILILLLSFRWTNIEDLLILALLKLTPISVFSRGCLLHST